MMVRRARRAEAGQNRTGPGQNGST